MRLIDKALNQIIIDTINKDLTAIEELLKFIDDEHLIGYLAEDE